MNTVAVIGRMLLALIVVLAIMWVLARWARKPLGGKSEGAMAVLARQQVTRNSSVAVLRVVDRALVLGVTDQGVRLLTELELDDVEHALADSPKPKAGAAGNGVLRALSSGAGQLLSASRKPLAASAPADARLADAALADARLADARLADAALADDELAAITPAPVTPIPVTTAPPAPTRTRPAATRGKLDGSALSPATWRQLLDVARDATVRR